MTDIRAARTEYCVPPVFAYTSFHIAELTAYVFAELFTAQGYTKHCGSFAPFGYAAVKVFKIAVLYSQLRYAF